MERAHAQAHAQAQARAARRAVTVQERPSLADTGPAVPARPVAGTPGAWILLGIRAVAGAVLGVAIVAGLIYGGLFVAPSIGTPVAIAAEPPRRPPIVPPSVPEGARADWAWWSYVTKINEAWGKDWPFVIQLFEEYEARYPGSPTVRDKLYTAYLEDGRTLQARQDFAGARRRYEQAVAWDPDAPEAHDFLAELDEREAARR